MTNEFDKAIKFNWNKSIQVNDKAIVSKHILKKATGNITLFAFGKGEGLSEHTAPFDALVHIIEGKAEVLIDGKSHQLESGEAIVMPANIPHALNATEDFKMILTMIKEKAILSM